LTAHRITEAWDETVVTFNTCPNYETAEAGAGDLQGPWPALSETGGVYADIEITSLYNGWMDGSIENHGIAIRSSAYAGDSWYKRDFVSSDSANFPEYTPVLRVQPQ
jgi:hypothetical protein